MTKIQLILCVPAVYIVDNEYVSLSHFPHNKMRVMREIQGIKSASFVSERFIWWSILWELFICRSVLQYYSSGCYWCLTGRGRAGLIYCNTLSSSSLHVLLAAAMFVLLELVSFAKCGIGYFVIYYLHCCPSLLLFSTSFPPHNHWVLYISMLIY